MTREEASNILDDFDVNFAGHTAEEIAEAFDVAFKALSQEPTAEKSVQDITELEEALLHIKTRADAWAVKEVEKALSQEPVTTTNNDEPITIIYPTIVCEDAVSREAVIQHVCEDKFCYKENCKGRIYKRCPGIAILAKELCSRS